MSNIRNTLSIFALTLVFNSSPLNAMPDQDFDNSEKRRPGFGNRSDDSEVIIDNIKTSLPQGMVSLERSTGRLLFNPKIDTLNKKPLKEKFFLPAMVVDQSKGLRLVTESPLSCFVISAGELGEEEYKKYRQHTTLRYIQDVKRFNVSKVLICDVLPKAANTWRNKIKLDTSDKPFLFEEHTSINGEHFYYYLDESGTFEMYI